MIYREWIKTRTPEQLDREERFARYWLEANELWGMQVSVDYAERLEQIRAERERRTAVGEES